MLSQIDGVWTIPYRVIPDERGRVHKISMPPFDVLDTYVTTVRANMIKAWHGYQTKNLYWTVVSGFVRLVLVDGRDMSPTFGVVDELYIGEDARFSVLVPPGVWNGFKGIAQESHILVQASELYEDAKVKRLPYNSIDIPYDWSVQHG